MNSLHWYLLRRLVLLLFVTVAVLTILFVMFKLLPGDPLSIFVDSNFSVEMIRRQKRLWGLDDPIAATVRPLPAQHADLRFRQLLLPDTAGRDILAEKLLQHGGLMIVPALMHQHRAGRDLGASPGWRRGSRMAKTTVYQRCSPCIRRRPSSSASWR